MLSFLFTADEDGVHNKAWSDIKIWFEWLQDAIDNYKASLNGANPSISNFITSLKQSKVNAEAAGEATEGFSLKLLVLRARALLLNAALGVGIGLLVSWGTKKITEAAQRVQNVATKSKEAADAAQSATSSLKDLVSAYEELGDKSGWGTEDFDQAKDIQAEILDLAKEQGTLDENKLSKLDLQNGKYEEQLGLLQDITAEQLEASRYELTQNKDAQGDKLVDTAKKNNRTHYLTVWSAPEMDMGDQIKNAGIDVFNKFGGYGPDNLNNADSIVDYYNEVGKALKYVIDNTTEVERAAGGTYHSLYQFLLDEQSALRDDVDSYNDSTDAINNNTNARRKLQAVDFWSDGKSNGMDVSFTFDKVNSAIQTLEDTIDEFDASKLNELLLGTNEGLSDEQAQALANLRKALTDMDFSADTNGVNAFIQALVQVGIVAQSSANGIDAVAQASQKMEDISSKIDEIQTAYKNATTAIDEYNKYGYLSADTLQTLLNEDFEYLSCLELVDGQLQVNTEKYQGMIAAQYQSAAMALVEKANAELAKIAQGEKKDAIEDATKATEDQATALTERVCPALGEFAKASMTAAAAQEFLANGDAAWSVDPERTKEVYAGLASGLDILDATVDQIMGNSDKFRQHMNGFDKETKNRNKNTAKSVTDVASAFDTLNKAMKEYNQYGYLCADTAKSLVSLDDKFTACLTKQGDKLQINIEQFRKFVKEQLKEANAAKDGGKSANEMNKILNYLDQNVDTTTISFEQLTDAIKGYGTAMDEALEKTNTIKSAFSDLHDVIQKLNGSQFGIADADAVEKQAEAVRNLVTQYKDYPKLLQNIVDENGNINLNTEAFKNAFVDVLEQQAQIALKTGGAGAQALYNTYHSASQNVSQGRISPTDYLVGLGTDLDDATTKLQTLQDNMQVLWDAAKEWNENGEYSSETYKKLMALPDDLQNALQINLTTGDMEVNTDVLYEKLVGALQDLVDNFGDKPIGIQAKQILDKIHVPSASEIEKAVRSSDEFKAAEEAVNKEIADIWAGDGTDEEKTQAEHKARVRMNDKFEALTDAEIEKIVRNSDEYKQADAALSEEIAKIWSGDGTDEEKAQLEHEARVKMNTYFNALMNEARIRVNSFGKQLSDAEIEQIVRNSADYKDADRALNEEIAAIWAGEGTDKEKAQLENEARVRMNTYFSALMDQARKDVNQYSVSSEKIGAQTIDTLLGIGTSQGVATETLDKFQSAFNTMTDAAEEFNKYGKVSQDTLQAMADIDPDILKNFEMDESGNYKVNATSMRNAYMEYLKKYSEQFKGTDFGNAINDMVEAIRPPTDEELEKMVQDSVKYKKGKAQHDINVAAINASDTLTDEEKQAKIKEEDDKLVAIHNDALKDVQESEAAVFFKLLLHFKGAETAAEKFKSVLSDIKDVFSAILDLLDEITSKQSNDLSLWGDAMNDVIDKRIDDLNKQKEALEENNDATERAIELAKAQDELARAEQQRTTRVYTENGYEWQADPEAVRNARQDLNDKQRQWNKEDAEKAIDDQIKKYNEFKDKLSEVMEDIGSSWDDYNKKLQYTAQIQDMTLKQMEGSLDGYHDKIIASIKNGGAVSSIQTIISNLETLIGTLTKVNNLYSWAEENFGNYTDKQEAGLFKRLAKWLGKDGQNEFKTSLNTVFKNIKGLFNKSTGEVADVAVDAASDMATEVATEMNSSSGLVGVFQNVWNAIKNGATNLFSGSGGLISNVVNWVAQLGQAAGNGLANVGSTIVGWVSKAAPAVIGVVSKAGAAIGGVVSKIGSAIGIGGGAAAAGGTAAAAGASAIPVVAAIVAGAALGVNSMVKGVQRQKEIMSSNDSAGTKVLKTVGNVLWTASPAGMLVEGVKTIGGWVKKIFGKTDETAKNTKKTADASTDKSNKTNITINASQTTLAGDATKTTEETPDTTQPEEQQQSWWDKFWGSKFWFWNWGKKASGDKGIKHSGMYNVDEQGSELLVRQPASGRYTYLETGDGVVPADITSRLFEMGGNPDKWFTDQMAKHSGAAMVQSRTSGGINMTIGDVNVNNPVGDADALARQIVQQLPNKMVQQLNKR